MKSSNVHAILSELYKLLSDYTADDFAQACAYRGTSPSVKDALSALAREADRNSPPVTKAKTESSRPQSEIPPITPRDSDRLGLVNEMASMIRRQTDRFSSTSSILQFAKEFGLAVQSRPKESRERLARRVAEAVLLMKEPKRSQIVAKLAGNGDSQTQGWIDVIKNR